MSLILHDDTLALIVRARAGSINTTDDLVSLLGESDEWKELWAEDIVSIIQDYDRGLVQAKKKGKSKSLKDDSASEMSPESEDPLPKHHYKGPQQHGVIAQQDRDGYIIGSSTSTPSCSRSPSPVLSFLSRDTGPSKTSTGSSPPRQRKYPFIAPPRK